MENRLHLTVKTAIQQLLDESFLIKVIGDFAVDKIFEFVGASDYQLQQSWLCRAH